MSTAVTFPVDPTNLDYLMPDVRFQFGDLDGTIFSDQIIRMALISAVRFLQRIWNGKYQLYLASNKLNPQPSGVPSGFVRILSLHGLADVSATLTENSIFRDPYVSFTDNSTLIESVDEQALILCAVYLLRKVQITSNVSSFISWSTEDIKFSNLGSQRGLSATLAEDLANLNAYIKSKMAKPRVLLFPVQYIPVVSSF